MGKGSFLWGEAAFVAPFNSLQSTGWVDVMTWVQIGPGQEGDASGTGTESEMAGRADSTDLGLDPSHST